MLRTAKDFMELVLLLAEVLIYGDNGAMGIFGRKKKHAVQEAQAESDFSDTPTLADLSGSEQTIKAMDADDKPKPPRARDVPENPELPQGVIKIRCKHCLHKMKADSFKFGKQRRCPKCSHSPFIFKLEG